MLKKITLLHLSLFCIMLFIFFNGCDDESPFPFMEGNYHGIHIFTRNFGTDSASTRQDSLIFVFGRNFVRNYFTSINMKPYDDLDYYYSGNSYSLSARPILTSFGGGEYSINSSQIYFRDIMIRLAIYDGSVIIQGKFDYSYDGGKVTMTQNDTNNKIFHRVVISRDVF